MGTPAIVGEESVYVKLHRAVITQAHLLHIGLHPLDEGSRVLGAELHLGYHQPLAFYPGDDGGDVASDIFDPDTVSNSDICQGGGVGHFGQVDVLQVHIEHLGDVAVVDEGGH